MARGTDALLEAARGRTPTARPRGTPDPERGSTRPLMLVATLFTAAQLLLVRPGLGLGWDEVVY
ncbi:MAG TPA: hypothetical protein VFP69_11100, partial [Streptomyces sp.]|nr:hypothetical protein [Streptomyces sp.]